MLKLQQDTRLEFMRGKLKWYCKFRPYAKSNASIWDIAIKVQPKGIFTCTKLHTFDTPLKIFLMDVKIHSEHIYSNIILV